MSMRAKAIRSETISAVDLPGELAGIGAQLRAARKSLRLTLREVEDRTSLMAKESGNPGYRMSGSWLDRVERENRGLSATKLIVLALIYNLTPSQILRLCPGLGDHSGKLLPMPNPDQARSWGQSASELELKLWLPEKFLGSTPPEETTLLPPEPGAIPAHFRRVVIGTRDRTMDPMILAGSVVFVDTQRRAIARRQDWNNEFDRPIYLLFARDGYYCGYCELDQKSDWLKLVPHMLSPEPKDKRWKFKHEVEVMGTAVALFQRRSL